MLLGLEARLGERVAPGSAILTWLTEYASSVLRRVKVHSSDGKSSYERLGRKSRRALPEFGERILFRPEGAETSAEPTRMRLEISIGVRERSDELIVADGEQVL